MAQTQIDNTVFKRYARVVFLDLALANLHIEEFTSILNNKLKKVDWYWIINRMIILGHMMKFWQYFDILPKTLIPSNFSEHLRDFGTFIKRFPVKVFQDGRDDLFW